MPKAKAKVKPDTVGEILRSRIDAALKSYWRGCSHERDIADEIRGIVNRILEEFDLTEMKLPEQERCLYCGSGEHVIRHKAYCVEG